MEEGWKGWEGVVLEWLYYGCQGIHHLFREGPEDSALPKAIMFWILVLETSIANITKMFSGWCLSPVGWGDNGDDGNGDGDDTT